MRTTRWLLCGLLAACSPPSTTTSTSQDGATIAAGDAAADLAALARDAGNVADAAIAVDAAARAGKIHWRPGHRFFVGGAFEFHGTADAFSSMDALVKQDTGNKIVGFEVAFTWGQLESQAGGVYDGAWDKSGNSGFAAVQALIAHVKAYEPPRDLSIQVNSSGNGQTGCSSYPTGYAPAYLNDAKYGPQSGNNRGGVYCGTGVGPVIRYWNAAVVDKMVSLGSAYGEKLGDDIYRWDPIMEVASELPGDAGFSGGALNGVIGALAKGLRSGMPKSLILLRPTFLQYQSDYPAFFAAVMPYQVTIGNYDSAGSTGKYGAKSWGDMAFRGQMDTGPPDAYGHATPVDQPGWINYLALGYDFESYTNADELGGRPGYNDPLPGAKIGSGYLPDIIAHDAEQHASHHNWLDNEYAGPNCNRTAFSASAPANPEAPNGPGGGVAKHPNLVDFVETVEIANTAYPAAWP